jgi:hypothetical protein
LLFYVPLCLVMLTVMEMCRDSRPGPILRRVGRNFLTLTGILVAGSAVFYVLRILLL